MRIQNLQWWPAGIFTKPRKGKESKRGSGGEVKAGVHRVARCTRGPHLPAAAAAAGVGLGVRRRAAAAPGRGVKSSRDNPGT